MMGRMRLSAKLVLAFASVVLVAVLSVAVLANRVTQSAFQEYLGYGQVSWATTAVVELASFYADGQDWDGVGAFLDALRAAAGRGRGQVLSTRYVVVDAGRMVVADTAGLLVGDDLSVQDVRLGVAIELHGRTVGWLVPVLSANNERPWGEHEQTFEEQVNRAIVVGGVLAFGLAVLMSIWLARRLTLPLRTLEAAAHQVAQGDLTSRVAVESRDELGDLAQAFNQMAGALDEAERMRQQMTADIAHELRTPVTVLRGHLEALQDGVFEPTSENLAVLVDETGVLSRLIEDLRDLSLAESGELALDWQPADPAHMLENAARRFAARAEAQGVALQVEIARPLPMVCMDAQRLQQVLGNLLSNALRYTPAGGSVSITGQQVDEPRAGAMPLGWPFPPYVLIEVIDTGEGIPAEHVGHVFDRFYRADRSRSRESGGSGLGLTIARQLVRAHGGEMDVHSEMGKGTRFVLALPLNAERCVCDSLW